VRLEATASDACSEAMDAISESVSAVFDVRHRTVPIVVLCYNAYTVHA